MKKLSQILLLLFAATVSLTAMVSCSQSEEDQPAIVTDGYVDLKLAVSIPEAADMPRQSYELNDAYPGAEMPVGKREMINCLRIIIVDNSGKVEANTLITQEQESLRVISRKFRVKANEMKTVYLLANEPMFPELGINNITYYDLAPEGRQVSDQLLNMVMELSAAQLASINLPMTAVYRLPVYLKYTGEKIETVEYNDLKVMRDATKFTVEIRNEQPQGQFVENPFKIQVSDMSVTSISDRSYLFPHIGRGNSANIELYSQTYLQNGNVVETATGTAPVISGGSNKPLDLSYSDFFRDNYIMPEGAAYRQWQAPEGYSTVVIGKNETHRYPSFYGNESINLADGNQKYYFNCTLVDTEGKEVGKYTKELPNLSSLPRNTHVVIKATFKPQKQTLTVTVVPYVGVTLDPVFGLPTPPQPEPDPDEEEEELGPEPEVKPEDNI